MIYVNARQRPAAARTFTLAAYGTADPAWLMARVREIAHALDPDVPPRLRTIEQVFASSVANRRYSLWLVAAFALAAHTSAVTITRHARRAKASIDPISRRVMALPFYEVRPARS